jgi:hypothetical protein
MVLKRNDAPRYDENETSKLEKISITRELSAKVSEEKLMENLDYTGNLLKILGDN